MRKSAFRTILLALLPAVLLSLSANSPEENPARVEPFRPVTIAYADSILSQLSMDQKISLLVESNKLDATEADREKPHPLPDNLLAELPEFHFIQYRHLQYISPEIKVLTEQQLASISDTSVLENYLMAVADMVKYLGFNAIVGPSLDLYYNDFNANTQDHSLGDDAEHAAYVSSTLTRILQSEGILVTFDHFPGMGNTERIYDGAPPLIFSSSEELRKRDLVPFKAAINSGLGAVKIGHAIVPGVDSSMGEMASESRAVMKTLLRDQLGFNGLIITDLYDPKGKEKIIDPVKLIQSGGQLMLTRSQIEETTTQIRLALDVGMLEASQIDKACTSVIKARRWIKKYRSILKTDLDPTLNLLSRFRKGNAASMVLLRNEKDLIPFKRLDTLRMAYIKIGGEQMDRADVQRYARLDQYHLNFKELEADYQALSPQLSYYDAVILAVDAENNLNRKEFGLSDLTQSVIDRIANRTKTVLVWNGHHRALMRISNYPDQPVVLLTHVPNPETDDLALQALFGGRRINGKLRGQLKPIFERKTGIETSKTRLAYGTPEEINIDSRKLISIDLIAQKGIDEKAYPGCQVWLAKDGMVVHDKAYGQHTYKEGKPVERSDLYDLASITKIAASTAALMHLNDEGKFSLDKNLCDFIPEVVDTTEYMNLNFREILAHQAGLPAWIPFYSKTLSKGVPRYDVYSLAQSETYPIRVANNFFIRKDYPEQMYSEILSTPLAKEKKYKYSDIGYYFALKVIEKQSGMSMDDYLDSVYYAPLGLSTMTYKPLEKFDKDRIVPTEYDRNFRNQLIHGDVHDPGAAMLGGVGGHAGLFSNANDLGVLMQMFMQEGEYGFENYINPETLDDFIQCQFCENDNRRGAGFDKPLRDGGSGPTCGCTDKEAFGHQGFTGTTTWADQANGIVYVFLSNRVYPDANNKKLLELNIRTDIQQVFYDAVEIEIPISENP